MKGGRNKRASLLKTKSFFNFNLKMFVCLFRNICFLSNFWLNSSFFVRGKTKIQKLPNKGDLIILPFYFITFSSSLASHILGPMEKPQRPSFLPSFSLRLNGLNPLFFALTTQRGFLGKEKGFSSDKNRNLEVPFVHNNAHLY